VAGLSRISAAEGSQAIKDAIVWIMKVREDERTPAHFENGELVAHALVALAVTALRELDEAGGDSTALLQEFGEAAAEWELAGDD
jgi:hypothetical protein